MKTFKIGHVIRKINVNDKSIKVNFDSTNKIINIMYYDLADNPI